MLTNVNKVSLIVVTRYSDNYSHYLLVCITVVAGIDSSFTSIS